MTGPGSEVTKARSPRPNLDTSVDKKIQNPSLDVSAPECSMAWVGGLQLGLHRGPNSASAQCCLVPPLASPPLTGVGPEYTP